MARASGLAVTKIFVQASGQITVPISRPSSTAPPGRAREGALQFDERRADLRDRGDDRRRFRHLAAAQRSFIEIGQRQAPRGGDRGVFVGKVAALLHQRPRGGPVKEARVEMRQAKMPRKIARQRALPRRRRAIDGDDHEKRAPSCSMSV